jgi:hypothetical protein
MRIHSRLIMGIAAVAAAAAVAPIRAQEVHLIARVPFAFAVGSATLPRDTYRITRMTGHPEMLVIRGDWKGTFVRTEEVRSSGDDTPRLTFHRYGDQYFLREVRIDGRSRLDLHETPAERDAAERRSGQAAAPIETIVITAEQR